jgi:uncharacterized membrane protein YphA (DoxX/SURF4 family)
MRPVKRTGAMKQIGYWVTTAAIALETLAGGGTDLVHGGTELVAGQPVVQIVTHEGYPVYVLTILGMWKLLGGITLLIPRFPRRKRMGVCRYLLRTDGCAGFRHRARR